MENLKALSLDDLKRIAGGTVIENGILIVDMSEYHCTWFSYAMGYAKLLKAQGYSREAAIQGVYDYYMSANIKMLNLEQCITQERWDREK